MKKGKKRGSTVRLQIPFLSPRLVLCRRIVMTQSDGGASQMHGHTPKAWRIELQMQRKYSAKEEKKTASILYAKSVPNNSFDTFLQIAMRKNA